MDNSNDNSTRRNEHIPGQEPLPEENEALKQQENEALIQQEPESFTAPDFQESSTVEETINAAHQEPAGQKIIPVEEDYKKHEENPGPSPEAVNEDNDNGAGPVMKWLIPILVIIMLIYWFVIRK